MLLPNWVRSISSPPVIIGTPALSIMNARPVRAALRWSASTAALVPAVVVVVAAVGRAEGPGLDVLLAVVGIQIAQREAVVGDHEVDRMPGLAAVVTVQIRRAGEAAGQLARGHGFHAQLVLLLAQGIAVLAVPLGPAGREAADLVGVAADRPRLGDQVDDPLPPPAGRGGSSLTMRLSALPGSILSKLKQPCWQVLPSTEARSKRKPSTPSVSRQ